MYICTDRWTDGRMLPTCLQHSRQMSQIFFFPSFTFIFASQSTDDLTYLRHLEKLVTMLRQSSPKRQVVRFVRVGNGVCAVLPVRVNYPFTSDAIAWMMTAIVVGWKNDLQSCLLSTKFFLHISINVVSFKFCDRPLFWRYFSFGFCPKTSK